MSQHTDRRAFLAGFAVHVFTASGAALAFMALIAAFEQRFPDMFLWLALALVVDGIDGTFARAARVKITVPHIDGDILDLVVDFLTYVLVPIVAIWRAGIVPPALAVPLAAVILTSSALYFADGRMKTEDLWFRGFPAIWNILALYLFAFPLTPMLNAAILAVACALMFAPITFVHPMRVERLRVVTLVLTAFWLACATLVVASNFEGWLWAKAGLLAIGVYYLGLSAFRGRA